MGLHALFSALLARYSNETDIVLGSPVANREQVEVEGLIGFFVNTLVLRSRVDAQASVQDLVRQSRETCLGAYAHQQVPFEKLVEVLQVERSLSHHPLFQVMLVLQNTEDATLELPGLQLTALEGEWSSAKFDLTLNVAETGQELLLNWEYSTDLFTAATITQLAAHFNQLVMAALAAQTSPIRQLTLLSCSEQQQLFQLSQGPQLEVTALPVQQRFESYAQQFPQQIALKESEFHYSYQQLDQHANGLALLLRDRYACQQGQLVAFCVQRGFAQIVTLLAILKAGCCYVPLDPSLPDERLLQILSSYPDLLLLSDEQNASRFSESAVRLIAGIPQIMATQPPELPNWHPALPLYVLHTSGSTGKPKAVEMSHGALASFLAGIEHHEPLLQGPKRMLQFASIGFDMSFTDIFLTLGHGGCLTLIPAGQQYDPAYLTGLIKADQLSVLNLPYAMLVALATYCVEGNILLPEIRCLVSTAEQLKISPVLTDFFSANPHIALVNHYGPTETHVVTAKRLTGLPGSWPALPDIGHPIANVQTLILDSSLQLVPRGVVGELYLAGQSLATGYLGEAELTRQSFIENPFYAVLPVSGPRLYKTGDLVRWRQDGTLEYLGRNDFQVKIRGFRVELGDVEHALRQCGVAECLVMAVPDAAGDLRLVAYVRADAALDVVQLQQEITTLLPVYMVPAAVVAVEKFALNANGKIDRKALPKPDIRSQQLVYQAPQTATEQVLAGIWQQLLAIEQVGRLDNFFMLGGHSLLATRLASQIRQQLGVDLPLHVLFSAPQLHVIAGYLDSMLLNTTEHGQFADDCVEEGFI
jgi:amino acid adenylation domain-containing protein